MFTQEYQSAGTAAQWMGSHGPELGPSSLPLALSWPSVGSCGSSWGRDLVGLGPGAVSPRAEAEGRWAAVATELLGGPALIGATLNPAGSTHRGISVCTAARDRTAGGGGNGPHRPHCCQALRRFLLKLLSSWHASATTSFFPRPFEQQYSYRLFCPLHPQVLAAKAPLAFCKRSSAR